MRKKVVNSLVYDWLKFLVTSASARLFADADIKNHSDYDTNIRNYPPEAYEQVTYLSRPKV